MMDLMYIALSTVFYMRSEMKISTTILCNMATNMFQFSVCCKARYSLEFLCSFAQIQFPNWR